MDVRRWLADLGLSVGEAGGEVTAVPPEAPHRSISIAAAGTGSSSILHRRTLAMDEVRDLWAGGGDSPLNAFRDALGKLSGNFPLVSTSVDERDGRCIVEIRAPVFEEGLSRQAFVLTVSSVLKAIGAFDEAMEMTKATRQLMKETESIHERLLAQSGVAVGGRAPVEQPVAQASVPPVPPPPQPAPLVAPAPAPVPPPPAPAFIPTHVSPAGGLSSWPAPDPSAPQGPHIDAGLPLQVVEQRGAWAKIRASNGWEAWVDGRLLWTR